MWTYGNIRIFVQSFEDNQTQIVAQLQPLDGGTIYQFFGYEKAKVKVNSLVVGTTDAYHLKTLTTSGTSFELVGPEGSLGNFIPETVKINMLPTVYQTIRTDMDCLSPIYTVEMELLKE